MKKLKEWWRRLRAKTPKMYARIRNASVGIIAAIGAINATAATAQAPEWFITYQWYALAVCAVAGLWAQSHEKKEEVKP